MAHFAKIENDMVTNVIVAEQSYIDTLDGEWVQTSYNTYGGQHYGPDQLPDNNPALRKNYAGIGFHYDRIADAFYAPKPNNLYELDTETYLWKVKAEYAPLFLAYHICDIGTMVFSTPGNTITIDNIEMAHGATVLFTSLSTNSGIYRYNQAIGAFDYLDKRDHKVVIGGDYSIIYKYENNSWITEDTPE